MTYEPSSRAELPTDSNRHLKIQPISSALTASSAVISLTLSSAVRNGPQGNSEYPATAVEIRKMVLPAVT